MYTSYLQVFEFKVLNQQSFNKVLINHFISNDMICESPTETFVYEKHD